MEPKKTKLEPKETNCSQRKPRGIKKTKGNKRKNRRNKGIKKGKNRKGGKEDEEVRNRDK